MNNKYKTEYMESFDSEVEVESWEDYFEEEDVYTENEYDNCIWENEDDDTIVIGKDAVEVRDENGEFAGYVDPQRILKPEVVKEEKVVPEKVLSKRCLTQTVAPWAKKKVVVEVKVNEEEFPALGAKIVKKSTKKVVKKEKPTKKKPWEQTRKTNNIFTLLEEDEKPKKEKKQPKKETKMCWEQFQAKAKEAEKKTREKAFNTLGDKKQLVKKLEKTTMCKFGKKCTRKVCHFAHNLEELKPRECLFGKKCRHGVKCHFFHPHCEDKLGFLKRTQKQTQQTYKH